MVTLTSSANALLADCFIILGFFCAHSSRWQICIKVNKNLEQSVIVMSV